MENIVCLHDHCEKYRGQLFLINWQIKLDFEGWELYNSTLEAKQESRMLHFLHIRRSCYCVTCNLTFDIACKCM